MRHTSPWISCARSRRAPQLRLFCFPYAGGGASIYREWTGDLSDDVEVWTVNLPGRDRRIGELPIADMRQLAEELSAALCEMAEMPFAFFGHSMGALLGFEVARAFRRGNRPLPLCLFVSAHRAPDMPSPRPPTHHLPREEFISEVDRLNGTPAEVLENSELLELILPMLRADFRAVETYEYASAVPLSCPIVACHAADDIEVPREHVEAWRRHTTGAFVLHTFRGDHFYINEHRRDLTRQLDRDIERLICKGFPE